MLPTAAHKCPALLESDKLTPHLSCLSSVATRFFGSGFLDRYDPDHICNTSDNDGRYTYQRQPEMCRWNCNKLVEALAPVLSEPKQVLERVLAAYDEEFEE